MFGVGLPELAVIAFVAVLVIGPEKLPDLAKQAGRMLRQLRNLANVARDELREELDLDPREIVRKHVLEAMEDDDDEPAPSRPREKPLKAGELPPYDVDAT